MNLVKNLINMQESCFSWAVFSRNSQSIVSLPEHFKNYEEEHNNRFSFAKAQYLFVCSPTLFFLKNFNGPRLLLKIRQHWHLTDFRFSGIRKQVPCRLPTYGRGCFKRLGIECSKPLVGKTVWETNFENFILSPMPNLTKRRSAPDFLSLFFVTDGQIIFSMPHNFYHAVVISK